MKTNRRNFLKIAGVTGTSLVAGGWSDFNQPDKTIKVSFPVDGDMLTGRDGIVKDGSLLTKVKISDAGGSSITVNGNPAKYDGKLFLGDVLLKDYKNVIEVTDKVSGDKQNLTVYWLKNIEGKYRFSLDDNILFLKDLNSNATKYKSIFENQYLGFLKQVHVTFGSKIHLNLYYQTDGFNLSQMTEKYKNEWKDNAAWLRLSFHALQDDPDRPYLNSGYDEVKRDCAMVKEQIKRFAWEEIMDTETTLHWGAAKVEGCRALRDSGYKILAGYFVVGKNQEPVSYYLNEDQKLNLSKRVAWRDNKEEIIFSRINIVINLYKLEEIVPYLDAIKKDPDRSAYMDVMIHEQYYHPTYKDYQPDYRQKVLTTMKWVTNNGYKPAFLNEVLLG
jgi:hypothetical protein